MDEQQTLRIITSLANGVDPETGEAFPDGSPYQRSTTIRALFNVQRLLEGGLQSARGGAGTQVNAASQSDQTDFPAGSSRGDSQRRKSPACANAGKPWSTEEDRQLLAMFDADKSLAEIAHAHGRTVGGVRARLEKHGRLEPSPGTRWSSSSTAATGQARTV
jgi:hypothetical protein